MLNWTPEASSNLLQTLKSTFINGNLPKFPIIPQGQLYILTVFGTTPANNYLGESEE